MQGKMRMGAVPVQKMDIILMPGQDAVETEEAISKSITGLESQEQSCFDRLHTLLSRLPVPISTTGSKM
jgi:hypothetical protein